MHQDVVVHAGTGSGKTAIAGAVHFHPNTKGMWKLPGSVSAFVQRAGRAARDPNHKGLAVLLVEKTAYSINLEEEVAGKGNTNTKKVPMSAKEKAGARGRARNILRAVVYSGVPMMDALMIKLNICSGKSTLNPRTRVFTYCCKLVFVDASPALLNRTRPGVPIKLKRKTAVKKSEEPIHEVESVLREWRRRTYDCDHQYALYGPSAILPDEMIQDLASVGPVPSLARLQEILADRWCFIVEYGDEVVKELGKLTIPEISVSKKRNRVEESGYEDGETSKKDMMNNSTNIQNQGPEASTSTATVNETPMSANLNHSNPPSSTLNPLQSTHPHPYYMSYQWLSGPERFAWYYVPSALPPPTNLGQSIASYPPYQPQ
ncbi:hypothetical protein D9758_017235 [Tetrapyrgos nigripes]|uniref:Helicase C-terminal domain-containing protein n=1 Tax=Tetrapyrgos nigripes TaxID=182062 RepID=A0A8H5C676_9AGAR|nr:hypothetical protein D9758_017235 [Tetrapyrgos nigripes]